jgi:hypothetical protein
VDCGHGPARREYGAGTSIGGPGWWWRRRWWGWWTPGDVSPGPQAADADTTTADAAGAAEYAAGTTADAAGTAEHAELYAATCHPSWKHGSWKHGGGRWHGRHVPAATAELSAAQRRLHAAAESRATIVAKRHDASAAVGRHSRRHGSSRTRRDSAGFWRRRRVAAWQCRASRHRRQAWTASDQAGPAARPEWLGRWQREPPRRWIRQSSFTASAAGTSRWRKHRRWKSSWSRRRHHLARSGHR